MRTIMDKITIHYRQEESPCAGSSMVWDVAKQQLSLLIDGGMKAGDEGVYLTEPECRDLIGLLRMAKVVF